MEENNDRNSPSVRTGGSFKSTLSGRSTPRTSPSFRRLNSGRTPRREGRSSFASSQRFRGNRVLLWLFLITLWAYLGFLVQSRWAHSDKKDEFSAFGIGGRLSDISSDVEQSRRNDLVAGDNSLSINNYTVRHEVQDVKKMTVALAQKDVVPSPRKTSAKKKSRRSRSRGRARRKLKPTVEVEGSDTEEQYSDIPKTNTTYGLLVGPFGMTEDKILEWSPEKRSGTCNRKGDFARLVWSRRFILIFHELSMTGAPLSMMELATELLSCGASVSAVVLSRKGGLLSELARKRIKVLEDRSDNSFKTAMKSDLVIAGSAVCASWIEQYIERFPAGASQVAWWIMENRREYFDRSKAVLHRVKLLVFLSELQSKQWQKWCEEENIKLRYQPALVPLSVNDELAFVAGLPSTLNTPSFSAEKMLEKRQLLRDAVRKEMGLTDNDMLVMTLSSINPSKGQLLLLESAGTIVEHGQLQDNKTIKLKHGQLQDNKTIKLKHGQMQDNKTTKKSSDIGGRLSTLAKRHHIRSLMQLLNAGDRALHDISSIPLNRRKVLSNNETPLKQSLRILIGSVGSKSNKVDYVKGLLTFLSQHSNLSKSVSWTPATTRVASLYSAADVYVINSQVLGTDSGGTLEIVEHNVTGLLHPTGRPGIPVLAQNLRFFLENRSAREQMGSEGRKKVQRMYLKKHMYKSFVEVIVRCMRSK